MTREEEIRARLALERQYWKSDTKDEISYVQAHNRFIANAPSDIDYLLKEIQKSREENSRLGIEVLELNQQIGELKFDINIKVSVLKSVESIINNSHGVSGWHMNGEIATWGELGLDDEIAQALQGDTE